MFIIKRGTTPTLEINIEFNVSKVACLEFILKRHPEEEAEELVVKKYTSETLKFKTEENMEGFIALVDLTREDTFKLPIGNVFMDTRITTVDDKTPRTDIVKGEVVGTFFKGAHSCD